MSCHLKLRRHLFYVSNWGILNYKWGGRPLGKGTYADMICVGCGNIKRIELDAQLDALAMNTHLGGKYKMYNKVGD